MANIDVVARLQLRAEQFSSETGARFTELKQRATSSAQEVRSAFAGSFAEVQRLAASALDAPRLKGGGVDLSGEIAQLRSRAAALDEQIEVNRALSVAYLEVRRAGGVVTEQEKLRSDAATVATRAMERQRDAIRDEIGVLEQLQPALNRNISTEQLRARAHGQVTVSAGQQRQSMMQLGQQTQDFAVQVVSGQSVLTAFAQQFGQAAFAIQGMGGKMAGVAAFLTSTWGMAATTAAIVLVPLIGKMLEHNNALDDSVTKMRESANEARVTADAQKIFADSAEGVSEAIRKQNEAMVRQVAAQGDAKRAALDAALAEERKAVRIRETTVALLEQVRAEYAASKSQTFGAAGGAGAGMAQSIYAGRVGEVEKMLADARSAAATAQRNVGLARAQFEIEQGKRNADPIAKINAQYDAEIAKLAEVRTGTERVNGAIARQSEAIERRRQAALKEERDRQNASERSGRTGLGTTIANEGGAATLAAAQRYIGTREDTAGGRATLRDLFGNAGISIDPEKVAWCAAFVNAVLAGQGIKGTGSLAARSFLNYGTATNRPTQGDIVVLRRGGGDQGHTGFYAGTDTRGRVLVTGGNQSDGVSTAAFARSDVLGFRRAPTASRAYADELRAQKQAADEAKRANAELERSLDQLADRFDPATAAARQYRDEVAAIIKLQAAGKLGAGEGFDLMMGARQRMVDARSNAFNESFRSVIGEDSIRSAIGELDAGIMSATDLWNHRLELGAVNAGEALAGAVGNIADMFGLRIGGAANALLAPGGIQGGARETAKLLGESLKGVGLNLSDKSLGAITTALAGAATGQIGGSIFSGITGKKNSAVGSAAGGILGELAGKELGKVVTKEVGGALGKTLGGAAGPIGSLVGGALGGLLGGLFQKAKTGAVSVTGSNVGVIGGNNAGVQQVLSGLGGAVQKGVNRIVDQLGGTLGDYMVSIGKYDDYYRVSSTNTKTVGEKGYSPGRVPGLIYDGTDESAAVEAAIRDAIADGAVKGISEAAKRVLAAGKDLDSALNKALLIESVPRDLKAMLDPVGAAVDDLNRRFQKTVDALKEGGASAEEMARAEQLYNLQLQQVKNSTAAASASLKSFLTDLKLGGNSPYSLREQEATALAQLKPYLDQIGAGQRVDQDKYQQAARAYLDVERQLYGSTQAYFDAQAQIQAATAKAIETIDNAVPITTGVESPFAKATADSAAKTASNTATGNELLSQLSEQMESVRQLLAQMQGGGASGFIGDVRAFG